MRNFNRSGGAQQRAKADNQDRDKRRLPDMVFHDVPPAAIIAQFLD
jgi:hypothetical protein